MELIPAFWEYVVGFLMHPVMRLLEPVEYEHLRVKTAQKRIKKYLKKNFLIYKENEWESRGGRLAGPSVTYELTVIVERKPIVLCNKEEKAKQKVLIRFSDTNPYHFAEIVAEIGNIPPKFGGEFFSDDMFEDIPGCKFLKVAFTSLSSGLKKSGETCFITYPVANGVLSRKLIEILFEKIADDALELRKVLGQAIYADIV
ncbi:hypothetical protein NO2_1309 [Candidatus Termititenax persephonae]|uniref:Uncharacterized protein n=1 Tax=Candidatus Termititenax persephonae TaxID=2218525 RepID=A0A388TI07_9BACT|nr:hypothetical protein NO2_1309 [Candidatus Termititenax persephonae]